MKRELKYIELKSWPNDNGPSWIGYVGLSRTGRTYYFDGKILQRWHRSFSAANFIDIETGEDYWISSVKKKGTNRYPRAYMKTFIEKRALNDFLKLKGWQTLDTSAYELTEVDENLSLSEITEFENQKADLEIIELGQRHAKASKLTDKELDYFIEESRENEQAATRNSRKFWKAYRARLTHERAKRKIDGKLPN